MKKTSGPHPLFTEHEASNNGAAPNFATVLVNELLKLYIANHSEKIPCLTPRCSSLQRGKYPKVSSVIQRLRWYAGENQNWKCSYQDGIKSG
jgi:hypothetical protein